MNNFPCFFRAKTGSDKLTILALDSVHQFIAALGHNTMLRGTLKKQLKCESRF